jgi:hypothetical protein
LFISPWYDRGKSETDEEVNNVRGFYRRGPMWGRGYRRPFVHHRPFLWRPVRIGRPLPIWWGLGALLFPGLCIASMFVMALFRLLAR